MAPADFRTPIQRSHIADAPSGGQTQAPPAAPFEPCDVTNSDVRPSGRSLRGLDWLNFFVADVRTGGGPFVAVYLTQAHWNVMNIGIALTIAELAGVATQAPGGRSWTDCDPSGC